jgi:transposase
LKADNHINAAVRVADPYAPETNPRLAEFCRHEGMSVLVRRPHTPQNKGKVGRDVEYVKENALKGRVFRSLLELKEHLWHWEATVAEKRDKPCGERAEERPSCECWNGR